MTLRITPLHDWHRTHGGRLVDFAGWSMPVQYQSIVAEHQATRQAMALFDVSHMGRLVFSAPHAIEKLEPLVSRRTGDMRVGQVRYGLVCNPTGGVLDDILVYRVPSHSGATYLMWVVNASNREKILAWLSEHVDPLALGLEDRTEATAMIAVQGPRAIAATSSLCETSIAEMKYYHCAETRFAGRMVLASRTGYTGEDGFELIVQADDARAIWETCLAAHPEARPAGLGARDTLRLEAGMPLYGHELREDWNPLQAGLDFAVSVKDRDFIGRSAIVDYRVRPAGPVRVGLKGEGKRAPREGYRLYHANREVGVVTSGTHSPTLDCPIAMAYVDPTVAQPGTVVEVDLRGSRSPLHVTDLPFYRRA